MMKAFVFGINREGFMMVQNVIRHAQDMATHANFITISLVVFLASTIREQCVSSNELIKTSMLSSHRLFIPRAIIQPMGKGSAIPMSCPAGSLCKT
jgi:hypothetical protein